MDKEEIISIIKKTFSGVKLNGGISLKQAEATDNCCGGISRSEFNRYPLDEITADWSLIPDKVLDNFNYIAHLDSKGFKYYIPAFIIHLLQNYDHSSTRNLGTLDGLYPKKEYWEYHMERYSHFDRDQRTAIAKFLEVLPDLVELDHEDKKIVQRALENYWSQSLPKQIA